VKKENEETLSRRVEALRGVYSNKGINLADDEATALAHHLGKRPVRAAILCGVIIIVLVAFLIVRFVL
jgi:hypothetical protein